MRDRSVVDEDVDVVEDQDAAVPALLGASGLERTGLDLVEIPDPAEVHTSQVEHREGQGQVEEVRTEDHRAYPGSQVPGQSCLVGQSLYHIVEDSCSGREVVEDSQVEDLGGFEAGLEVEVESRSERVTIVSKKFTPRFMYKEELRSSQKEGNGKCPQRFALSEQVCDLHPEYFIIDSSTRDHQWSPVSCFVQLGITH